MQGQELAAFEVLQDMGIHEFLPPVAVPEDMDGTKLAALLKPFKNNLAGFIHPRGGDLQLFFDDEEALEEFKEKVLQG